LWFKKWYVLLVYRQSRNLTILHISFAGREAGQRSLEIYSTLKRKGIYLPVLFSDGGRGILLAVKEVYPHTAHQVCLAHMHRRVAASLGIHSKDDRVRELRAIADHVWKIESKEALAWWKSWLKDWVERNISFLKERRTDILGNWWFVHRGVRKAARTLASLPKISFTFLDYPTMPRTTNELEAQFGHLGKRWLAHRGLKQARWSSFVRWFVYFYNQEKQPSNTTKRD